MHNRQIAVKSRVVRVRTGGGPERPGFSGAVALTAGVLAAIAVASRRRNMNWGARPEELRRAMPLDDEIRYPTYVTNRAITIAAPPARVWPWLVQMGESPRGGFYSYEWIERLLGMKVENAESILPALQDLEVGDVLDRKGGMVVKAIRRGAFLVLGPRESDSGMGATWCIALYPEADGATRLVSRCRARLPRTPTGFFWRALLDPGQFIMERRWLLGVKERAERPVLAA